MKAFIIGFVIGFSGSVVVAIVYIKNIGNQR